MPSADKSMSPNIITIAKSPMIQVIIPMAFSNQEVFSVGRQCAAGVLKSPKVLSHGIRGVRQHPLAVTDADAL